MSFLSTSQVTEGFKPCADDDNDDDDYDDGTNRLMVATYYIKHSHVFKNKEKINK